MIILAHDGSLYCDWVARYAFNFATAEPDGKLLALHVVEDESRQELISGKFEHLAQECRCRGIHFIPQLIPPDNSVYRSLCTAIPHDSANLLVCGTRKQASRQVFLRGSLTEKLLRCERCPVLAIRVVQPGLLGTPHQVLMPLAGHVAGLCRIQPVVQRLATSLRRVHLFRSLHVHHGRQVSLSAARQRRLINAGHAYLEQISGQLAAAFPDQGFCLEQQAMLSSDWPHAVLMQAGRLRVQMILLGVSERSLAHRTFHGAGIERVLQESSCDVGIYRGP